MPKELPTEVRAISTWEDLDRALLAMRVTEARIVETSARYDQAIQTAQEEKSRSLAPLTSRKERMEALIKGFVEEHREGLKGKKSIKMVHGKVGFRLGNAKTLFASGEEHTIKMLKLRGHIECVVVKEEIDSAALKNLPPSEKGLCGIAVEQRERFYYDLASDPPIVYPAIPEEPHDSATTEG